MAEKTKSFNKPVKLTGSEEQIQQEIGNKFASKDMEMIKETDEALKRLEKAIGDNPFLIFGKLGDCHAVVTANPDIDADEVLFFLKACMQNNEAVRNLFIRMFVSEVFSSEETRKEFLNAVSGTYIKAKREYTDKKSLDECKAVKYGLVSAATAMTMFDSSLRSEQSNKAN